MEKHLILYVIIISAFVLTSCAGNTSATTPTLDTNMVASAVATTLSGISTATPVIQTTATFTVEPSTLLPRSLYYLAQDANGIGQIYRLSRDGTTITQITFEQEGIYIWSGFDVSSIDGRIVYSIQNNLIRVDSDGKNRQVLIQDQNIDGSRAPVWSPDGKIIAYNSNGINLYSLETKESETILPNEDNKSFVISFSPDGSKLIASINFNIAIYNIVTGDLFTLQSKGNGFGNLNDVSWLADSKQIFIFADVGAGGPDGIVSPGLWRFNVEDGSGGALLPTDGTNCVQAPKQEIDGNLTYLYATSNGCPPSPHSLVRSSVNGITDRVVLRPETFVPLRALWTPDGQALVIVQNNGQTSASLILVPVDPTLPVVVLMNDINTSSSLSLRWGP